MQKQNLNATIIVVYVYLQAENRQTYFGLEKPHWLYINDIFMKKLFGCKCPLDFFLIFTKKQEPLLQLQK